ncbi:MAG TPA: S8 family serine peptidase [Blastocatellia bacterium]|nr:S8 family serine peptidase [Blastocatellia bacterium]
MKLKTFVLILLLFAAAPFSLRAQNPAEVRFRKGEVIVELKPGASVDAINARYGTRTLGWLYGTNIYRLGTPNGKKEKKFRRKLRKDANVVSAELNPFVVNPTVFARAFQSFPNDRPVTGQPSAAYNAQQELMNLLKLQAVWQGAQGEGVVVAIIDTGVNRAHPDLAQALWTDDRQNSDRADGVDNDEDGLIDDTNGWDFVDNDNDPTEAAGDPETTVAGHGTFIAGIIKMMAPKCRILPVRACPADGLADAFTVASAIKYAADHGAAVINLSLGAPEASPLMANAIAYARERGALVVAAAGNENRESPAPYPANTPEALAVAAIDMEGRKAGFSNYGPNIDVAAPGVSLISTYPGNSGGDYARWSGTSFAAPFATAEAALVLDAAPAVDARKIIEDTAANVDSLNPGLAGKLGKGRIDPLAALQAVSAAPVRDVHKQVTLTRTAAATSGGGKAEISVSGANQEFEIEAHNLRVGASYRVAVDGVELADVFTPNSLGGLKIEYATEPGHLPLPPALNPVTNIRRVELRAGGVTVLEGAFGAASAGNQSDEKEARLTAAGAPGASGRVKLKVEPERETLEVRIEDLPVGDYTLVADAITVGAIAIRSDFFRARFTSDGSSGLLLPPGLSPVTGVRSVEVRDGAGVAVMTASFAAGGGDDGGGGGGDVRREAQLTPTGRDPDAEGRVEVEQSSSRERIKIEARELQPNAEYAIFVDGSLLGSVSADDDGRFDLEWDTDGNPLPLPPQFRPVANIRRVEVRDAGGTVLVGILQN